MDVDSQYSESASITFEWTLRDLKELFESTKGDKKSKVTKSCRFGGGKWQILFYANAGQTKDGTEGGGFVSLYLSCEPTAEEKEAALSEAGKWVREGVYKFSFELRNVGKTTIYNSKEANNHSFTYKTANWGWAQFARRDSVYYQSPHAKAQDAFVIICQITSSPTTPTQTTMPKQPVPKLLLDTVGMLLDDPRYSDIQFVLPRRGQDGKRGRSIWASKRLLSRGEYFQSMFHSQFVEGSCGSVEATPRLASRDLSTPTSPHMSLIMDEFEDSDDEDDETLLSPMVVPEVELAPIRGHDESTTFVDSNPADSDNQESDSLHNSQTLPQTITPAPATPVATTQGSLSQDPSKTSVIVRDTAYSTFRAMLYYIYTDNIVFAPLSSSFINPGPTEENTSMPIDTTPSTPSEGSNLNIGLGSRRFSVSGTAGGPAKSRAEWIKEWMKANPGRPAPCSAKSMYRVADRFELWELKERAAAHIIKSLTVENIAYEVFSPFAAAFSTIRKSEIDFFLNHWHQIRASEAMKNVWVQIRNGRHPGFEEVWPLIAQSLEFKPMSGVTLQTVSTSHRMQDME